MLLANTAACCCLPPDPPPPPPYFSSVIDRSDTFQDFTLDFYLRQTWKDPRLAFGKFDIGWKTDSGKLEALTVSDSFYVIVRLR
jgi:hypothetical protein